MKKIKSVAERKAEREKLADIKTNIKKTDTVKGLKAELERLAELVEEHINS